MRDGRIAKPSSASRVAVLYRLGIKRSSGTSVGIHLTLRHLEMDATVSMTTESVCSSTS